MHKWFKRFLQLRVISCIFYVLSIIALSMLLFYNHGVYNFEHIPLEEIPHQIYRKTIPNLVKKSKTDCDYSKVLNSAKTIDSSEIKSKYDDFSPKGIINGSFLPEHCNPTISVAVLVTYRNRQKNLDVFLPYMHNFLRQQNIHYKIFLIEQQDDKPWNKGLLYNVGARIAIREKFPCLILHDVDLLPLDSGNLYACTVSPRHLSGSIDKFRFVLPYGALAGGVLALTADHYGAVDGFSQRFHGWGGEDDDFAMRLDAEGLDLVRFPRQLSRYSMLRHAPAQRNAARHRLLAAGREPRAGYSALAYRALTLTPHRLFTLLAVQL